MHLIVSGRVESVWGLVYPVACGMMLGRHQPMIIHLHHRATDDVETLKEKFMLLHFGLIKGIVAITDVEEACRGVVFRVLIGKVPSKTRTLRLELKDTLASTLKQCAPSILPKNITCLTRLYHNCALGLISSRLNVPNRDVKNVLIWGNHSSPQHLDVNHAMVNPLSGEYPVRELINDDVWLNGEFITEFQKWVDVSNATGTALDAFPIAKAACNHMLVWVLGTSEIPLISSVFFFFLTLVLFLREPGFHGVFSNGSYNVPKDLLFSFLVTFCNGEWTIVQGHSLDEFSRKKIDLIVEELMKNGRSTAQVSKLGIEGHLSAKS
ncbi:hypothetical protein ACJRO7_031775 [Eucalyptus globulus]|uniref:Lactate/malate dehydrogenase C-terminal domain-containing protein n=1 Tax=Eucalyptus globulus TaxID=34317 RepID=A0ABD3JRH6_EUCGL